MQTNRNTTEPDDECGVSLAPSSALRASRPPTLDDIKDAKPTGTRDEIAAPDLPLYVRRAGEVVARAAGKPLSWVLIWALQRGLVRIAELPDVRTVRKARGTLQATGSDHIAQIESWPYRLQARDGGSKRITLREISKGARNNLVKLAADLGIAQQTAAALCVVCGLVDAPSMPEELPEQLSEEVRAFLEGVHRRAVIAADLAKRAADSPAPVRQLTWGSVVGEED